MLWERSGSAFHATVEDASGRVLYRLIVEELPNGTWDWAVWRSGAQSFLGRHGVTDTIQEAIQAAEAAATQVNPDL
jgi:hypothetical protein